MRPLSEATSRISAQSFQRKYIALGRIVNYWTDIIGPDMAQKAQPVKINYRKNKKTKAVFATLEIAASSADATVLHYQKELILERINQIFGERWVTGIKFVNVTSNTSPPILKRKNIELKDDDKKNLTQMLQDLKDHDISQRLQSLGEAILKEEKLKHES